MSSQPAQPPSPVADSRELPGETKRVPVALMILLFLLLYWGALYFDENGGWFSPQVYAPFLTLQQVEAFQIRSGAAEIFDQGRAVYNKPTCVACHQASGQGSPGQFPPLAGSEWVTEPEPGRIIRLVLNGLQGPITVKGQPFNNVMVPWNNLLSDQEVAAVLTYIRQNPEWGNNASAVTAAQVKAVRDKLKTQGRVTAFTADELMKLSPAE
jgi:mono/diheme cytochrome c family protein